MSFLGSDALGHLAIGQVPQRQAFILPAATASVALGGQAIAVRLSEVVAAGSFAQSGVAAPFKTAGAAGAGFFAWTGRATMIGIVWVPMPGHVSASGHDILLIRDFEAWFPRPFDTDQWTGLPTEGEAWAQPVAPLTSWSSDAKQAESWTPAIKQTETWIPE